MPKTTASLFPRLLLSLVCLLSSMAAQAETRAKDAPSKPPAAGEPVKLGQMTFNTAYSDHFALFTKGCRAEPAAEGAEKVLAAMCKWNPHLAETLQAQTDDYLIPIFNVTSRTDQTTFKSWYFPVYQKAGADEMAMNGLKSLWDKINGTNINLDPDTAKELKCHRFGSFINMESSKAKNEPLAPFRVHNIAGTLQGLYLDPLFKTSDSARDDLFWITAGFVYFAEIRLSGMTETSILDYENMPDTKEKGGVKPSAYADGKNWPENVRKLAKAKKTSLSLAQLQKVYMASLTPDQLAFCFALQDYLHSTPELAKKYYAHLHELRAKPALPDAPGLAKAMGHADVEAFDKAFWDYLKSTAFKN